MTQTAKLIASDEAEYDFNQSVAISGNTVVIGVPGMGMIPHPGMAFVFERLDGIWTQKDTLTALDGRQTTVSANGNHTYMEESTPDHTGGSDTYPVTVVIHHENSPTTTVNSTATVADPAVAATAMDFTALTGQPFTGVRVATFTDPGGAEAVGDYSATIDWGDGTTADATGHISRIGIDRNLCRYGRPHLCPGQQFQLRDVADRPEADR